MVRGTFLRPLSGTLILPQMELNGLHALMCVERDCAPHTLRGLEHMSNRCWEEITEVCRSSCASTRALVSVKGRPFSMFGGFSFAELSSRGSFANVLNSLSPRLE